MLLKSHMQVAYAWDPLLLTESIKRALVLKSNQLANILLVMSSMMLYPCFSYAE